MTPFKEKELEITDGYVDLPDIDDGALMFVYCGGKNDRFTKTAF